MIDVLSFITAVFGGSWQGFDHNMLADIMFYQLASSFIHKKEIFHDSAQPHIISFLTQGHLMYGSWDDLLTIEQILALLKRKGFRIKHRSTIMRWFRKHNVGKLCDRIPPKGNITKIWKIRRGDFSALLNRMKNGEI